MSPAGRPAWATGKTGEAVAIRVESRDFARLFGRSAAVERKLKTTLRRNIRIAGKDVVVDLQNEVRGGSYGTNRGLRDRIAAGIGVSLMTGAKPGIVITASPKAMQDNEKSMVAAWQSKKGWRHPAFGNPEVWVSQMGRPFFFSTVARRRDQITTVVRAAMVEAAESLKKG